MSDRFDFMVEIPDLISGFVVPLSIFLIKYFAKLKFIYTF